MMRNRRGLSMASVFWGALGCLVLFACPAASAESWRFDRLPPRGATHAHVDGQPQLAATPAGVAVVFDGKDDSITVQRHPLAGARTFTFEAIFRPDGGAFAQRWFHLAESGTARYAPPVSATSVGAAISRTPRIMFEIRVIGQDWYLDSFMTGPGYNHTLVDATKLHSIGRWYHVAQTYDGTTYRSYVDGVLENEFAMPFVPQGKGATSVGTRINHIDYFHGAIYSARFTRRALRPQAFHRLPNGLQQTTLSADR